jgi:hypothetical protein
LKEGIFRIDIMGWMPEGYMVEMLEVLGGWSRLFFSSAAVLDIHRCIEVGSASRINDLAFPL